MAVELQTLVDTNVVRIFDRIKREEMAWMKHVSQIKKGFSLSKSIF